MLFRIFATASLLTMVCTAADTPTPDERLSFQTSASWSDRLHLNADVAIVYGIDKNLPARIESWRAHGYRIHVMTGVSWGHYEDYLEGRFDGVVHDDQGQTGRDGKRLMHGVGSGIYYICPDECYGRFLCAGVQRALDAGAEAIHLEEPEFWARAGYSETFKREWKAYYHEEWIPPHSSVDAQYRASKLKYVLFQRTLAQVFQYIHDFNAKTSRAVRCYVPSHSLLNYAQWNIVSPESSLLNVGCDGFIAQVWTGTARTPNVYEGEKKERTFETAFLEYSAMQNLVRASGKRVWYLNDPIEDNLKRSWSDYRRNWENTLIASLLQPEVARFEIMPWPERVFKGKYPPDEAALKQPEGTRERIAIPNAYETELQTVVHALGEMQQAEASVHWEMSGTPGMGVLVSDTMMFQRGEPSPSDRTLGSFFGLAMPLIKRGIPVQPVQLEFAGIANYLASYKVLLLTYEGQKPPTSDLHQHLANWVKAGGALVIVDDDSDPYNSVREWWNSNELSFRTPREHLFGVLGIPLDAKGTVSVGKGCVIREVLSPSALTYRKDGGDVLRAIVRRAAEAIGVTWSETSAQVLRRGPFIIAAGLSESGPQPTEEHLDGRFINLFDADLKMLTRFDLKPDARALLVDLRLIPPNTPAIVAAACRTRDMKIDADSIRFEADGLSGSSATIAIALETRPKSVTVDAHPLGDDTVEFSDGLLRIKFANTVAARRVEIRR